MKETGTVLLYNINGARAQEITLLCKSCGLRAVCVMPSEFRETIGALLMKRDRDSRIAVLEQPPFSDEMMVIASDGKTLDLLLAGFREKKLKSVALKAMVTAVNISWTSVVLYGHLKEEHERMQSLKADRGGEDR